MPQGVPEIEIGLDDEGWTAALPEAEALARDCALQALLAGVDAPLGNAVLSISLADDAALADLNLRFRGKTGPTNVLSFPALRRGDIAARAGRKGPPLMLGDIAIARETVMREAAAQGKTLASHLRHMVVHGVLHLLGYDHIEAAEADEMEALERRILANMGVNDPYEA